jgi:hypothetical protein
MTFIIFMNQYAVLIFTAVVTGILILFFSLLRLVVLQEKRRAASRLAERDSAKNQWSSE